MSEHMLSCPEEELLRLARLFDQAALAELYDRYSDSIYYYSLRLLGDSSLAEDCAADTFSRLLRALRDGGGPTDNLKAYLFRSAHNWIADHFRRTPPLPLDTALDTPEAASDPAQEAEQNLMQARVRRALRLLTPEQRQVMALRFIEGWDLDEIATCLEKPLGAVKALQHRALAALRKMLLEEESTHYELQT
jgi:RNA polymerase sigma-70 factor, ECF subfamily